MLVSTLVQVSVPAVGQCEHPPVPRPEQLPRLQVRVDGVQLPAGPVVNQHSSAHPLAGSLAGSLAHPLAGSLAQEWDQKQQHPVHLQNIMSRWVPCHKYLVTCVMKHVSRVTVATYHDSVARC